MQPYVIKRGDFLALLAYEFGFDADTVWNDPANADLRKIRSDPNILAPTDVLYIPDPLDEPATYNLDTGQTNTFVADVPTMTVTLVFSDSSCASQPYTVAELPELTGQSSDSSGTVTLTAPIDIGTLTVEFTEVGLSFACGIGQLDPINTLSGIVQRLQNLGYLEPTAAADPFPDLGSIRDALRRFKSAQNGASDTPAPASSDASDDSSDDSSPASSDASSDSSDDSSPASDDASRDSSDDSPASDDAGLSDNGTLDDETSQLLLSAYGF